MDVRLLGQVEAIDGDSLPLAGPTQRRVLAALALRRNEVVSVTHLVDVIWPDREPPDRAEHNVRTYVHRLRSSLNGSDERIETVGSGYRLRLETDELDAAQFERLAGNVARLAGAGDSIEALDAVDEAERLWLGDPIEEFEHEPWAIAETVRLRELHTELRTQRGSALLDLGRPADAVAALGALIREEPLRERPRALLMRALYESGRQAEALRAYQDFRRLLVDEVGVEPSPDLVELDQAIATGDLPASRDEGRTVGNYELVERIGEGAFAVVHRATQASLGRDVAVKVVRAEFANRPEFIRRFEAEAQMVAAIEHPNVVPLYDFWREPDSAFLVMRWMAGGSLETRLDAGPWSLDDTVDLVDQIAAALTAAHGHGVVHRDVKPGNILFDESGRAYLGDFGIALSAQEPATPQAALSEGSPVFASPEQLRREPVGPEADVHALAIVAFTVLTGRTPFADSPDEATMLRRQLDEPIPSVSTLRDDLPSGLDAVLATATAKSAGDRYPTTQGFADAFRAAARGDGVVEPVPIGVGERVNPYVGLRAFSETDGGAFFGRDRLVDELVTHLAEPDQNMLALVGPSGSGKSSVVRAGLVPQLREGRIPGSARWFVTTMIPGGRPFEALETALLRVAVNPPGALLEQLRDGDRGILRGVRRIVPDDEGVVVVVIDQFEEVFTSDVPDAERERFLRALAVAATEPLSPLRVVLTLRADFYDEPLRHPEFAALIKRHTVVVTPLAADELEEAIKRPAANVGVGFEAGLVAEVAADVNSQPGALPLLQYALTQAFDRSTGAAIGVDDYRAIGGLSGALARRADDVWHELPSDAQVSARRLFGRLVALGEGTEDTRRRVDRSELPADEATDEAIAGFGRARLLTFDHNPATREPTIEIAHEALIREWQRLREWLDDDRDTLRAHRHLTLAAAGWDDRDRDTNELYRGARLDAAAPLPTIETVSLNDAEADFLRASVRQRDDEVAEEQARVRRLRRLVTITAAVAAIALVAGAVALVQWRRADDQAEQSQVNAEQAAENAALADDQAEQARANALEADRNAEQATENATLADERADQAEAARALADLARVRSSAFDVAERNPGLALLLAAEAYRMDGSLASADAVSRVMSGLGGLEGTIPGAFLDLQLADGGRQAVALGFRDIQLWDLERRELLRTFDRPVTQLSTAMEVSDSVALVAAYDQAGMDLIDLDTGEVVFSGEPVDHLAFSPNGDRLAVIAESVLAVWDVSIPAEPVVIREDDDPVGFVAWSPSGDGFVVVKRTWDVAYFQLGVEAPTWTRGPVSADPTGFGTGTAALFGSRGQTVVVASDEGTGALIRAYDLATGDLVGGPVTASANVFDLEWIDEEALTVVATLDTSGAVGFDLVNGIEIAPPIASTSARAFEYSPSLDQVIEGGPLGIRFWHPDGANPLERVLPLLPAQRELITDAVQVAVVLVDDGARAVVSGFSIPPSPVIEYDLTAETLVANDTGLRGVVLGSNGHPLLLNDEVVLLDENLLPVGDPIANPPSTNRGPATSPDGRFFALRMFPEGVDLYRATGELVANLRGAGAGLGPVSFSPDGSQLVVHEVGDDNSWGIFETSTGILIERDDGDGFTRPIRSGETMYMQSDIDDFRIRQIEPETDMEVGLSLVGQTSSMAMVIESVSGELTATSEYGGSVRVWDRTTGKQVGREIAAFRDFQFSDDGTVLAVVHDDHVSIWNYDIPTWVDLACEIAGRNMTRDEWDEFGPGTIEFRATCPEYPIEN